MHIVGSSLTNDKQSHPGRKDATNPMNGEVWTGTQVRWSSSHAF